VSGRRARAIRAEAARRVTAQGIVDRGGYMPRETRNRAGNVVATYAEDRLMPGVKATARRMRREHARGRRR
jgi:hypothetical protein